MADALEEMQSEGMADQVFHQVSKVNGSIGKVRDDHLVIKVAGFYSIPCLLLCINKFLSAPITRKYGGLHKLDINLAMGLYREN